MVPIIFIRSRLSIKNPAEQLPIINPYDAFYASGNPIQDQYLEKGSISFIIRKRVITEDELDAIRLEDDATGRLQA